MASGKRFLLCMECGNDDAFIRTYKTEEVVTSKVSEQLNGCSICLSFDEDVVDRETTRNQIDLSLECDKCNSQEILEFSLESERISYMMRHKDNEDTWHTDDIDETMSSEYLTRKYCRVKLLEEEKSKK